MSPRFFARKLFAWLYRDLNAKYENLLEKLRQQQTRFKYLSSYFETTAEKIQAVKMSIEEHEKKIEESETRSKLMKPLSQPQI